MVDTLDEGTLDKKKPIATADLDENAVTLAKMAGGIDGNLITFDVNGDPAFVATGSSTEVLTSNGVGTAPTFQATGGGAVQIFSTRVIFTSTAATRTQSIFGDLVLATDVAAQTILNSAITAVDNTIFLVTNSKTSTITFALNDDGVDVLQVSTTSGQTGEFSASGSVVVAAGSLINFTEDGGTSVGQLDYSMTLEYTR